MRTSKGDWNLQFPAKKCEPARKGFDTNRQRQYWRMASFKAVVHENRGSLDITLLQSSGHLADVRRTTSVIPITRDEDDGGIINISRYAVVRGICMEGMKIFFYINTSVFLPPFCSSHELLVADHLE